MTLQWVADVTSGTLAAGDPSRVLGEVTTDTRAIQPGALFVALKGARYDGHDFAAAALGAGAAAVVVERGWLDTHAVDLDRGGVSSTGVIAVADTLLALQDIARGVRRASSARVVAITGSAGKTTTKEAIASMLATRYRVVKNKGNLNNHIGLPLSLMELRQAPDVAVMELGMNHAGEIRTLVGIADPDVRVWTNVGDAHIGFFASADAIADAKAEILEGADRDDTLVCNADDPRVMARVRSFPGTTVTFGYSSAADVRAVDVEDLGLAGMRARLVTEGGDCAIHTPLLGRGNLANLIAAAAVALRFDVSLEAIAATAESLKPSHRRGSVHAAHGITVVDDSYNSSPAALRRTLDVLRRESAYPRKIAVLGEMLELGAFADALHRACGEDAASAGLAALVAVGGDPARALAQGALSAGMDPRSVHHVLTSTEAADLVASLVQAGDVVLVKGSRGIRTDVVVDRLVEGAA